jgi:NAD(P)-dependent dehydrogenase (short-subunit alcohol dehydrogenase family)
MLVLNAGVVLADQQYGPGGCDATFAVNHLGHFSLTRCLGLPACSSCSAASANPAGPWLISSTRCRALLPRLRAAGWSRVVVVSSESHRGPAQLDIDRLVQPQPAGYSMMKAYGQSKLCNCLFAAELHRRERCQNNPSTRGLDTAFWDCALHGLMVLPTDRAIGERVVACSL